MFARNVCRQRGVISIWVAILIATFVVFLSLAFDTGRVVLIAQELQVSADGSALAGAFVLRRGESQARDAAISIAAANTAAGESVVLRRNDGNTPTGDIVIGIYDSDARTFTPTLTNPNAVKVVSPRLAGTTRGPVRHVFTNQSSGVKRAAIARVRGDTRPGVVVLHSTERCSFLISGNSTLSVNNGSIVVDSAHNEAACTNGRPILNAQELFVSGGTDNQTPVNLQYSGEIITKAPPIPDPLAPLPEPNWQTFYAAQVALNPPPISVNGNTVLNVIPGYYTGMSLVSGTMNLAPGLYVIDGPLSITGGNFYAPGVMLYITQRGSVDIGGNGIVDIDPMNSLSYGAVGPAIPASMQPSKVTIFQARGNTNDSRILGSSTMDFGGRIYMPTNHVTFSGNGTNLGTGIIASTVEFQGNGVMTVNNDDFLLRINRHVWLVE